MGEHKGREVYALLREAEDLGIGLAFEPDYDDDGRPDGWTVSSVVLDWPSERSDGFPGAKLAQAYDLSTAVVAALKPLRQVGEMHERYLDAQEPRRVADE